MAALDAAARPAVGTAHPAVRWTEGGLLMVAVPPRGTAIGPAEAEAVVPGSSMSAPVTHAAAVVDAPGASPGTPPEQPPSGDDKAAWRRQVLATAPGLSPELLADVIPSTHFTLYPLLVDERGPDLRDGPGFETPPARLFALALRAPNIFRFLMGVLVTATDFPEVVNCLVAAGSLCANARTPLAAVTDMERELVIWVAEQEDRFLEGSDLPDHDHAGVQAIARRLARYCEWYNPARELVFVEDLYRLMFHPNTKGFDVFAPHLLDACVYLIVSPEFAIEARRLFLQYAGYLLLRSALDSRRRNPDDGLPLFTAATFWRQAANYHRLLAHTGWQQSVLSRVVAGQVSAQRRDPDLMRYVAEMEDQVEALYRQAEQQRSLRVAMEAQVLELRTSNEALEHRLGQVEAREHGVQDIVRGQQEQLAAAQVTEAALRAEAETLRGRIEGLLGQIDEQEAERRSHDEAQELLLGQLRHATAREHALIEEANAAREHYQRLLTERKPEACHGSSVEVDAFAGTSSDPMGAFAALAGRGSPALSLENEPPAVPDATVQRPAVRAVGVPGGFAAVSADAGGPLTGEETPPLVQKAAERAADLAQEAEARAEQRLREAEEQAERRLREVEALAAHLVRDAEVRAEQRLRDAEAQAAKAIGDARVHAEVRALIGDSLQEMDDIDGFLLRYALNRARIQAIPYARDRERIIAFLRTEAAKALHPDSSARPNPPLLARLNSALDELRQ